MLEHYFQYPKVLCRLRSGALGSKMDRIAAYLSDIGYTRVSAKLYLGRLAHFSAFAAQHAEGEAIEPESSEAYLRSRPTTACRRASQTAIGHARRAAPELFSSPRRPTSPHQALLDAYLRYLDRVRG